jgi:hypothetical protein
MVTCNAIPIEHQTNFPQETRILDIPEPKSSVAAHHTILSSLFDLSNMIVKYGKV